MFNLSKRQSMAMQASVLKRSTGVLTTHSNGRGGDGFEMNASLRPTNQSSMSVGNLPVSLDMNPTLSGFMFNREDRQLVDVYKDIYYYDVVAGTAADLLSTLPFSDFSLRGLESKMERPYMESLERLNIHTLLPEISIDYLVFGTFVGSLVFNKDRKIFVDIIPHDFKHCTIKDFPFYGVDPIINVNLPKDIVAVLKEDNDRVNQIKANYGTSLIDRLCEGQIELEPLSTLYIPRRTMTSAEGTSYFRRILPIYFMEKNLYRGSLAESIKRLRSILHITAGDLDWEPSPEDLKFISELFINADNDPIGAIVATRNGVNTNEIRNGGDFWKIEDMWNSTIPAKLKALNLSESFINGESSVQTLEGSMSGFVEQLRSYRGMLTRKIFYDKIFPLISLTNDFYIDDKARAEAQKLRAKRNVELSTLLYQLQDTSSLIIPQLLWEKHLKPEGDNNYLEILKAMTEAGVPVPIRTLAAAGGIKLERILKEQDEDIATRKKVADYMKKVTDLLPKKPEEGDDYEGFASALAAAYEKLPEEHKQELLKSMPTRSALLNAQKKPNFLNRFKGKEEELHTFDHSGKKKHIFRQQRAQNEVNGRIAKAYKNLQKTGKTL